MKSRLLACVAVAASSIAPSSAADISFAPALGRELYLAKEFNFSEGWEGMWLFHRYTRDLGLQGAPPPVPALKTSADGEEILFTRGLYRAFIETP